MRLPLGLYHKKGVSEQVFIFIFALIVVALILAWGTKTILDLKDRASQVQLADSVEDLREKAITYYHLEAGSRSNLKIRFPNEVKCICIKNINPSFSTASTAGGDPSLSSVNDICDDDAIQLKLSSGTGNNNLFVTPSMFTVSQFSINDKLIPISIGGNNLKHLCFDVKANRGYLEAEIEAEGDHVTIKKNT
ncbi:MAG: hypothetical protein AABX08_03025 [Nanoarchaeota archaeon]|mgnify:CR=1 FL=1